MCSTWLATSLIRLANSPVDWADGGVADQDPEAVGGRPRCSPAARGRPARAARASARRWPAAPVMRLQQGLDLAVDDDRVEPFLAAEVLVHDRLGHRGLEAISSTLVPSKPLSANRCGRRRAAARGARWPVIRTRPETRVGIRLGGGGRPADLRCSPGRMMPVPPDRSVPRRRQSTRRAASRSGLGPADVAWPSRASRRPRSPGRWSRPGRAARRGGRRSGRRGAGCARTRPSTAPPATTRCRSGPGCLNGRSPMRVADRVDRPGDVVQQADADEAAPEERGQRALPRHRPQAAERRRAGSSERRRARGRRARSGRCRRPSAGRGRTGCGLVCSTSNSQPMWA